MQSSISSLHWLFYGSIVVESKIQALPSCSSAEIYFQVLPWKDKDMYMYTKQCVHTSITCRRVCIYLYLQSGKEQEYPTFLPLLICEFSLQ
jgi:hypothetical protein